jgi:cytochrome c556
MLLAAALAMIFWGGREAQSRKEAEARVAKITHIMNGFQKPNMTKLSLASRRAAPETDKDWAEIEATAALLNETGFLLIEAGRSKDDVWNQAAADLRAASAQVAQGAASKNFDAVKGGVPKIAASCQSCHDAHQK